MSSSKSIAVFVLCALSALSCSKHRPTGVSNPDLPTTTEGLDAGSVADTRVAPPDDGASSATDDAPSEIAFEGDGPGLDPPTPIACPVDVARMTTAGLAMTGAPKAFVDAWNAELAAVPQGVLLLELRGLTGTTPSVAAGVPAKGAPATFATDAAPPATGPAIADGATRRLTMPRADEDLGLVFATTTVHVGAFAVSGVLDSKCESMTDVKVSLLIPLSAADTPFGASTLGALLGKTNDVIGSEDAWRVTLTGTVAAGGT